MVHHRVDFFWLYNWQYYYVRVGVQKFLISLFSKVKPPAGSVSYVKK